MSDISEATAEAVRRTIKGQSIAWARGEILDVGALDFSNMTLEDYCYALAFTPRFRGQTEFAGLRDFFGVLQHCFVGALDLHRTGHSPKVVIEFLTHESDEVIPGDMAGPLKDMFPEFRAVSKMIGGGIDARFGWTFEHKDLVKRQDIRMLVTEKRDLMPGHGETDFSTDGTHMAVGYEPLPVEIVPYAHPRDAVPLWLDLYRGMAGKL